MKKIWFSLFVLLLSCGYIKSTYAEVIWVGNSAACDTESLAVDSLDNALIRAFFNSDANDEIRLTNAGTDYRGGNGRYTMSGYSGLIINGGYSDCGVLTSGRVIIGYATGSVFTLNNSFVTFKNITLRQSGARALVVDNGSIVTLDNVMIDNNQSGIEVKGGAFVDIKANSVIQFNNDANTAKGGGIYCHGNSSGVQMGGQVDGNSAVSGGNVFAETGCFFGLTENSFITNGTASDSGGGVFIDNGGELLAAGGAQRVTIQGNIATDHNGGGIFVWGTGRVTLNNTFLDNNTAGAHGAAIFAANGGNSVTQLRMDRVDACPSLMSCSEIQGHDFNHSLVYAYNSNVDINRTIVELNHFVGTYDFITALFLSTQNARIRLNRVALIRNETQALLYSDGYEGIIDGTIEATHITVAKNQYQVPGSSVRESLAWVNQGFFSIQNSIIVNTSGSFGDGVFDMGNCNLIDNNLGWPPGTYSIGTPQFINIDGGDMRQVGGSLGVDMCLQDSFSWSTEKDLENQIAPVNEKTNPQGSPGQAGGLYDAGVDEVYDNIVDDLIFANGFE